LSEQLERRGFQVTSVDPSPEAIALLQARCRGPVVAAVAHELPFPDETFDAALLGEVLEHIEDDLSGLRGVARVVRPGGLVVISVPANPTRFGPSDEWAGHKRRYTRQALLVLCANAGLEVERLRPWGFPASSFYHRHLYSPRIARVGPVPPRRHQRPAVTLLGLALQVDRLFVGVERGALGYLLRARKPGG
jgi:SAM-dependent methyltransferase